MEEVAEESRISENSILSNWGNVCTICLSAKDPIFDIFAPDSPFSNIQFKLMELVQKEIRSSQTKKLCSCCIFFVDIFHRFKKQCENAGNILIKLSCDEEIEGQEFDEVQTTRKELNMIYQNSIGEKEINESPVKKEENLTDDSTRNETYSPIKQLESSMSITVDDVFEDETAYSSEDEVSLSVQREKLLKQKPKRKKVREADEHTSKVMRTVESQVGGDVDDSVNVVEMEVREIMGVMHSRSKRTQTVEMVKKRQRHRIRTAIPSPCTLCDKVYKNGEILRQHMKSHHVTGSIKCEHCQLKFTSLRSLKYHEQRNHSNLQPVPCSYCGKEFLDKKYLRIHENIHSQSCKHVCQFCGKNFVMKSNLTVHITRHHKPKSNDFVCQVCGKAFPFKLYLNKHFKTHTSDKPHSCAYCQAKFRQPSILRKHINTIHLKLRPFKCELCPKTFTRRLYLKSHIESQHLGNPKIIKCSKCGMIFANRTQMKQHECPRHLEGPLEDVQSSDDPPGLSHSSPKKIASNGKRARKSLPEGSTKSEHVCKTCDKHFPNESELLVHIFTDHKKTRLKFMDHATEMLSAPKKLKQEIPAESLVKKCDECDDMFPNESELLMHKYIEHLRRKKRNTTARCPDCDACLPCTKSLYQHIRQKHSFRCPDCHDGFATAELMQQHQTELGPHKEHFICQDCGLIFDDRRKLKEHMRKKVKCELCDKVFSSSQRLVEHKMIKHDIGTKKEYQCEICGKGFPYYSSLRYHKRTHGEKNIVCPICGQRFHFVCNYNVHVNLHHSTAEDNVVCDVCGEMVPKHKMRNHLTRHAQPTLPCDLCGKMFRFKGQLKRHKVRFHKDTPHPCSFCRKGFVKAENLKAHVARAHQHMQKRAAQ